MTHKAKIALVVAGIALAAICFFSGGKKGEMGVIYAGLASNDARYVSFTISNSFNHEMFCDYEIREFRDRDWHPLNGGTNYDIGFVSTCCTTNFTVLVSGTNRWQVVLHCTKAWPDNLISDARENFMYFAFELGWSPLEELSKIGYTWHFRYGPEMLGNKPLAEAQK